MPPVVPVAVVVASKLLCVATSPVIDPSNQATPRSFPRAISAWGITRPLLKLSAKFVPLSRHGRFSEAR